MRVDLTESSQEENTPLTYLKEGEMNRRHTGVVALNEVKPVGAAVLRRLTRRDPKPDGFAFTYIKRTVHDDAPQCPHEETQQCRAEEPLKLN